ncbi:MAG: cysteine-rich CWC family protein [Rhodocyclales bacterium]|nr:cysteine-rich CWC family protein [Rhodocyclales bacterium]
MEGGDARCWCADLPPLPHLPAQSGEFAASCLCPACLRDRLGLSSAGKAGVPS